LATTTFATGTYTTAGYTLVYNGSITVSATGWADIVLSAPYTRTTGTNLQMLIERADGVTHTGYVWNTANGNNILSTNTTCRRYNSTVALAPGTTSLTASAFRPAIKIMHRFNNDAGVNQVYTLGKVPLPNGTPLTLSANVSNEGINSLVNVNVTLTVTGANSFSNSKSIASLVAGANNTVSFDPFTPLVEGNNTVTVTVAGDDYNANSTYTLTQVANKNTWSYAYGSTPAGGVGFTGATGDFVAKFSNSLATALSQVTVNFSLGGQPYKIGIWDATGAGGIPGTLLWESASQTSVAGSNVLPVSPAINIAVGNFYVGVRQTGTTNVSFSYQDETPIRSSTFYYTTPTGSTTWTDFAPANSFRFMIEPKLILPVDAGVTSLSVPPNISCLSGSETFAAVLSNTGSSSIAPGAASVTLKVRGANSFTGTLNNLTNIISGGTETINFTGVSQVNGGDNFDTLYVTLAGDAEKANDTLITEHFTASVISNFPVTEDVESANLQVVPYVDIITGGMQLWSLQNGSYTNPDIGGSLAPHGGANFFYFDAYSGASSLGVIDRLYSNCLSIPAGGGSNCGYKVSFWMSHDASFSTDADSIYVSVSADKGVTWTRLLPGYARYNAAFTTPGWEKLEKNLVVYAGQTIQIGFEGVSKYGNIIGLDDITIASTAAAGVTLATTPSNGIDLVKTCDDQGWTYYADPASPTQHLLAIQWDPSSTGANAGPKANALPRLQVDPTYFSAENIPSKAATYTMRRYWNVNLNGSTMTGPVNVRFFYDPAEKTAVDNAAAAFALANAGTVEPATWFKTITGAFSGDVAHVTPVGVTGAVALTDINSSNTSINGIMYAQFNAVTGFSGGTYATGVGLNTPIPISLEYFRGSKQGNDHLLNWKLNCYNTSSINMTLERSGDSRNFSNIYNTTVSSLLCQQPFNFVDTKAMQGLNYYRLKMTDADGKMSYSNIVVLMNAKKGFELVNITPNPVTDNKFKLNISSAEQLKIEINITDLSGRILVKQQATLNAGFNPIDVNVKNLAVGTYQLFGITSEGRTRVLQFVKQ
jgi:hypothetical protein